MDTWIIKLLTGILSVALLIPGVPVWAETDTANNEIQVQNTFMPDEETEYEPIVHEEVLPEGIEFDFDGQTIRELEETGPRTRAVMDRTAWKTILADQFGDDYLRPYVKKDGAETLSESTNRLTIEETDIFLQGKNGLNLEIKRKYDSHKYSDSFVAERMTTEVLRSDRQVYAYKNASTGEQVLIGFCTDDERNMYMKDGGYVKSLNPRSIQTYNDFRYYDFSSVHGRMINEMTDSAIHLVYDPTVAVRHAKYKGEFNYYLTNKTLQAYGNEIGAGWEYVFPVATIYRDERYVYKSGNKTEVEQYYSGIFQDMAGRVNSFEMWDQCATDADSNTYRSTITSENNKALFYENFYEVQTLYENGPKYNYIISNNGGIKYYMYANTGVTAHIQRLRIAAIEDDYGNRIIYEYDSDSSMRTNKIIDTYGREIIIGKTGLSYFNPDLNERQTIQYNISTLPAETLANNSINDNKPVQRLTVTNEKGESTIYDAREAQSIIAYTGSLGTIERPSNFPGEVNETATGYTLERIIQPTGLEIRYAYIPAYLSSKSKVLRQIFIVSGRIELIDGVEQNKNTYTFSGSYPRLTKTTTHTGDSQKVVEKYDSYGLLNEQNIYEGDSLLASVYNTYDTNEFTLTKSVETRNGVSKTTQYTYVNGNQLSAEETENKKIGYNYHKINERVTDIPQKVTYQYKDGSYFRTDYYTETALTAGHAAVETTKTVQNDAVQAQTKYEYDASGNVTAVYTWTEDTNGDGILDMTDAYTVLNSSYTVTPQNTVTIQDRIDNVLDADGQNQGSVTADYSFNIFGSPTARTDSYQQTTTVSYDALNRPVGYTFPNGGTRTIEYNLSQLYTTVTDEKGVKTRYIYNKMGQVIQKQRYYNETWHTFAQNTYDTLGRTAEATVYTAENTGTKTTYTYDALNRVKTASVIDLSGAALYTEQYTYGYSSGRRLITKTTAAADGSPAAVLRQYYNNLDKLVKEEAVNGTTTYTKNYTYDYQGRKLTEQDANGNTTSYAYAWDGNVISVTDAAGNTVSMAYDLAGRQISATDAKGSTATMTYDALDRIIKQETPFDGVNTALTKQYYDKNSNVVKQMIKNNSPGAEETFQTTEYVYDSMGSVLGVIGRNSGQDSAVQYTYDTGKRVTSMRTGLTAYSEAPAGGALTQYTYDANGQLSKVTDPLGQEIRYTYDFLDNPVTVTDRNGVQTTTQYTVYGISAVTAGTDKKEYSYDKLGRLSASRQYAGEALTDETGYIYDAFGRKVRESNGEDIAKEYSYDANSNLLTYTLKEYEIPKSTASYTYNSLNQLTEMTGDGILSTYGYDANGNLTEKTAGTLETVYTYNAGNLPVSMTNKNGETVCNAYQYAYTLDGKRTGENETGGVNKAYQYDGLGRLTRETQTGEGVEEIYRYTYDANGNRTQMTVSGEESYTASYIYDLNNRLLKQTKEQNGTEEIRDYAYDPNGNQISWRKSTLSASGGEPELTTETDGTDFGLYSYDGFNRVKTYTNGVKQINYGYNAENLRIYKIVNGKFTGYVWNGSSLAAETSDNAVTSTYTYGADGITTANINGTTSLYLKNIHGDVIGITDIEGTMQKQYDYTAFGIEKDPEETDTNPFRYAGEFFDSETDNIYLRNRYYAPKLGRFLNEDTHWNTSNMIYGDREYKEDEIKIPNIATINQSKNLYIYCVNNPVAYMDLSGDIMTPNISPLSNPKRTIQYIRTLWTSFANLYLGNQRGYTFAKNAMLNALSDNPADVYISFGYVVDEMKNDSGFLEYLENVKAEAIRQDKGYMAYFSAFAFESGDLKYSIHNCNMAIGVTKLSDGQYHFDITITDTYDYTELRKFWREDTWENQIGWLGNDFLTVSQVIGALNPYKITVEFEMIR